MIDQSSTIDDATKAIAAATEAQEVRDITQQFNAVLTQWLSERTGNPQRLALDRSFVASERMELSSAARIRLRALGEPARYLR